MNNSPEPQNPIEAVTVSRDYGMTSHEQALSDSREHHW
jgi:hypothetical protein